MRLNKISGELFNLLNQTKLFAEDAKQEKARKEKQQKLEEEISKLSKEIEEIKSNVIYKNAFEWRFEFPEVLNNKGEFEGFDLIIGNPPYIKEYENRDAFNGLRNLECYQGKMDIWYLFGDLGLKILKPNNYLCYIATNNWVTNAGASNFRNIVIQNSQITNLTDFGAYMIFENASIQTMIMLFKNTKTADNYTFDYRKLKGDKLVLQDVLNLLEGTETEKSVLLSPVVTKANLLDKPLTFNTDENSGLLNKIKAKQNFFLREKADKKLKLKSELGQGIVAPQDFVNKASAEKLKGSISNGDGIFVLSNDEFEAKNFLDKEKEIIKPYFTTDQLQKYFGSPENTHWIIYTKSDINKPDKKTKKVPLDSYPKIKQHLDKFKSVITSDFGPYGLHRAREQYFFEGEKIMVTRKCPKEPIFTYTDFDCFVSQTFFVIQSNRINLKYLTGLLNSKLVAFWLRKKGKMQGNAYQLDKEPLLEIPIYQPADKDANDIAKLVDKIISLKQQGKDSSVYERKIDELVYQLYDITPDEQKIIEGK
jgi:adenine-specific DNA-methyltransferase